ncbi:NAD(P)-binding protein [Thozetella sp. PMI_491]|nr:NAD(P)-binding protein [Thozetella sp. PMI_491]
MKTWLIVRAGPPRDALELKKDWPTPAPPKGDNLLIRVSHAAINPLDVQLMGMRIPFRRNAIPAVDFCGDIIQAGPGAPPDLRVGATVCGTVPTLRIFSGVGVLSDYIVLPAHAVAEKPAGLEKAAAAGLMGVGGQTGVMLLKAAELREGARALVNGASGGVGVFLVQVLKAKGIHVTGICSSRNTAMVQRLGAEEVVDYTAQPSLYDNLAAQFRHAPFDAVFDLIGNNELYQRCLGYLKPNGGFYNIAGAPLSINLIISKIPACLGGTPRTYVPVMNKPCGTNAEETASWFSKGWVKEIPMETFEFEDALQAFEKLASKRAQGKIIIHVQK